jgi:selenocysteine lyase/cysteine desulfurase
MPIDKEKARKFYKKLLIGTQPFTDEPALSMLVSYLDEIEEKAIDSAIHAMWERLMERWFTLNGIRVMIPSNEIDDLCKSIRSSIKHE